MDTLHPVIIEQAKKIEAIYPEDVVVVFDSDGLYRYASDSRERLMGYTRKETYGRHYQDFVVPDYMSHVQLTWDDTTLTGQSIESIVVLKKKSGDLARFRTVAWATNDPDSGSMYMIVKSHLVPEK